MAENTVSNEKALTKSEENILATREEERYLLPAVDIFETEEGLTLLADMPGVEKDGIDIRVEDGILTISGRCTHEGRPSYNYREFELNSYWRQFSLSNDVDREKISAQLKHGVLTLTLPKAEKAKPKKIEVKLG